ncbi:MAG: hypothetical protein NZM00_11510 [Anaerolinea sp.]|nr:hypothetical protein [Anaerolinea sp.]
MRDQMIRRRDAKVRPHLSQYAPVWIVNEQFFDEDEAILFDVVFQHHLYGWVRRRYRYDAFNDVLYHKGQVTISEEEAYNITEHEPFIVAPVSNIPNAYGG